MDRFNANARITASRFSDGRTIIPGPLPTSSSSQGRILSERSVSSSFGHHSQNSQIILPPPPPLRHYNHHGSSQSQLPPVCLTTTPTPTPTSILRTDMSQMVSWLTASNSNFNSNMSQAYSSVPMSSVAIEDYFEAPQIPKPYNELGTMDCANLLGKAIRSIIVHTCNDEFRQQCFSKLGVVSSAEVEREIRTRLSCMVVEDEQRKQALMASRRVYQDQSEEEDAEAEVDEEV
ncbi:hypothetical protein Ocin01_01690 [Orchesella cincta]|uniref:Uncharacterized protein n=1 Tax=Orchesella cincta TaxID=48709 RepID=A0A1D2NIE5_ORCCI|nr:hypothetical protein Ocin01_01690 [Orchesella cincta]